MLRCGLFRLLLALSACKFLLAADDWTWKSGRATFYGLDNWSIMKGSCNYGYMSPDEPLGWDVAALADADGGYPDSCGLCYEVKCNQKRISDNYGESLDRTDACFNTANSLIVRITDTCPCTFAANSYGNKRWCCGDMFHMDISQWAFEKLASKKWGVMAISYRGPIPCGYTPESPAPASPEATGLTGYQSGFNPPPRDWPEYQGSKPDAMPILDFGYVNGFYDASWNAEVSGGDGKGVAGTTAVCAIVHANGAVAIKGYAGAFNNRIALRFWMYVGTAGTDGAGSNVADININIGSSQGSCTPQRIYNVDPSQFWPICTYCGQYWWRWVFYLPGFAGGSSKATINQASDFSGCGGMGADQLDQIQFRNDGSEDKYICLSKIVLE